MPTKYDAITIEPSTEITLAQNPGFARKVRIQLFGVKYPKGFVDVAATNIENVTRQIELGRRNGNARTGVDVQNFDGQSLVKLSINQFSNSEKAFFLLEPIASRTGTTHIQFRLVDETDPTKYHLLFVRVSVRSRMVSWWFGNKSINVPKYHIPHSKTTIFGLFDKSDDNKKGIVADISGHEYVSLSTPQNASTIFDVDSRGWITGKTINTDRTGLGSGSVAISLAGQRSIGSTPIADSMRVQVFDLYGGDTRDAGASHRLPILEKVPFHYRGDPAVKHNLLFIAEGFTSKKEFNEKVDTVVSQLFRKARNIPFPSLRKSFNIWRAFVSGGEHGISRASQIKSEKIFSVENKQLSKIIPELADSRFPVGPVNSYFGFINGKRRGDYVSIMRLTDDLITLDDQAAFDRFKFDFFRTEGLVFLDPRRYPRQFDLSGSLSSGEFEEGRPLHVNTRYILHALQSSLTYRAKSEIFVGEQWDVNKNKLSKKFDFRFVCYLINDHLNHAQNCGAYFYAPANFFNIRNEHIRKKFDEDFRIGILETNGISTPFQWKIRGDHNIRSLASLDDSNSMVDRVVHEFGHSFNLGDEYESPSRFGLAIFDHPQVYDNWIAGIELQKAQRDLTTGDVDGFIDPRFIKWRNLHHILLSEKITTKGTRDSDHRFTIDVGRLYPSRASLWKKFEQSPVFVQAYSPVLATVQNIKDVIQTKPVENPNSRLTYLEIVTEKTVGPLDYSTTSAIPPLLANVRIVEFNAASGRIQLESIVPLPNPIPDLTDGMLYRPLLVDGKPLGLMEPVVDKWIAQHGDPLGGFKPKTSSNAFTVDAGSDEEVFVGTETVLVIATANDPLGRTISYSWAHVDARPDIEIRDANTDFAKIDLTKVTVATNLKILVTAKANGATATDVVEITVLPQGALRKSATNKEIEQPSDAFMQHLRSLDSQFIPAYTSRIVGVYEGAQFDREMYRPAGACKMRNPHNDHGIGMGSSAFCPVCQYLITQRIDPSKHFIDTLFIRMSIISRNKMTDQEKKLFRAARELPK